MITTTPTQTLLLTHPDIAFHNWCDSVGIAVNPSARVITSQQSVAGRGVFAIEAFEEGEMIAQIPPAVVFHPKNAAGCFPDIFTRIQKSKAEAGIEDDSDHRRFRWIHELWRKVTRRENNFYHLQEYDFWQTELTQYVFAALEENHPWSEWISQWQRDDPTYRLFASNAKPYEEDAISATADELKSIMPDLPQLILRAALAIRLSRLEEERQVMCLNDDPETSAMYALLGSRASALDDKITGIIPFQDMINHSLDPNLTLDYKDEYLELYANRKIEQGEEFFLCYTKRGSKMNKNSALFALIQWGIPTPRSDYVGKW